jgi:hypothetical protein
MNTNINYNNDHIYWEDSWNMQIETPDKSSI